MKILILFSWNNLETQQRINKIKNYPGLKGDEFYFCFASGSPHKQIREKLLYYRMKRLIKEIRPDYLLVSTGQAFLENPNIFIRILTKLKKKYPAIKQGIEEQTALLPFYHHLKLFDEDEKTIRLCAMVFTDAHKDTGI